MGRQEEQSSSAATVISMSARAATKSSHHGIVTDIHTKLLQSNFEFPFIQYSVSCPAEKDGRYKHRVSLADSHHDHDTTRFCHMHSTKGQTEQQSSALVLQTCAPSVSSC